MAETCMDMYAYAHVYVCVCVHAHLCVCVCSFSVLEAKLMTLHVPLYLRAQPCCLATLTKQQLRREESSALSNPSYISLSLSLSLFFFTFFLISAYFQPIYTLSLLFGFKRGPIHVCGVWVCICVCEIRGRVTLL